MSRPTVQILYTEREHFGAFTGMRQLLPHLDAKALEVRVRAVLEGRAGAALPWPLSSPRVRFVLEGLLHRGGRPWYCLTDLAAETAVLKPWLSGAIDVLHYLDGEHSARFLPAAGRSLRLRGGSIATFHQPLSILPGVVPARLVRSLDHITVVSISQRAYFTDLIPEERVRVIQHGVAWHHASIRKLHDERRVVAPAIGIDQQPRVAREERRRVKRPGQMLGHRGSTDVVGDMPGKILRREAEGAIGRRNQIGGVVAENEHATFPISLDAPKGRTLLLLPPQPTEPLLHRHPLLVLDTNPGSYLVFARCSKRKGACGVKVVTQLPRIVGAGFCLRKMTL